MSPEDTPWLDARGLRMQIEAVLPVVIQRAGTDPDHPLSSRVQGKLHAILAVIRQQYSSRLILDHEILDLLLTQGSITAEEMWVTLASVRASLLRLEELEELEEHTTPYGSTAASGAPPWSPSTEHPDSPPGQPGNWRGSSGDRQYWMGAGRQHRRAAAQRSSEPPW